MKFEGLQQPSLEKIAISEDTLEQLNNLGITPEMINGSVLDIGAGDAEFAKDFFNKDGVSITSIDDNVSDENKERVDKIDARNLPYNNDTYDMVISHASVPNVFMGMYSSESPELSKESIENSVSSSLHEIIRVLKPGKTAYLAPISIAENYEPQRVIKEVILKVIDDLKDEGINVKLEFLNTYINPQNKEKTEKYRLMLEKSNIDKKEKADFRSEQSFNDRLAEYITGIRLDDPKMVERLMEDQQIIRAKYGLPIMDMRFDEPNEYERMLLDLAKKMNVEIRSRSEMGQYFIDHPYAGAAHFGERRQIGIGIDRSDISSYKKSIGVLEHELIHASQLIDSPRMPIELQDRKSVV